MTTVPRRAALLYVDTSGFYASASRRDAHHVDAIAVLERVDRERLGLLTTTYVVAEAHALFLSRLGHDAATAFLRSFDGSSISIVRPYRQDESIAQDIIFRYADKDFSLTDAIGCAVMQRLGIETAFSFDSDFRQFGFALA